MSYETLEVGDRVAREDGARGGPALGTVRAIRYIGEAVFDVEWDKAEVSKGWLRHALRKIPNMHRSFR